MNKIKNLLTIAIVFIILPNFAYANCTEEETLDFKRNEKYYKVTYEYDKTSNDYIMRFNASKKEMFDFVFLDQKNLDCKEVQVYMNENSDSETVNELEILQLHRFAVLALFEVGTQELERRK